MKQYVLVFYLLAVCTVLAEDRLSETSLTEGTPAHRYSRDLNDPFLQNNHLSNSRPKRQVSQTKEYHVTQCNYDNVEKPEGPSIQVLGVNLEFPEATLKAAKLLHLLVRFMPRSLYLQVTEMNTVGLFSTNNLPADMFNDFQSMPRECSGRCTLALVGGVEVDCSTWCTTKEHPYQPTYTLNYLWSYGNFSRVFLTDTNMVCKGYNPGVTPLRGTINLLIQEFGFMMMTRIMNATLKAQVDDAFTTARANNTWPAITSKYDYFMKATLVWFNGIRNSNAGGMSCLEIYASSGLALCTDSFGQRQYIKQKDIKLYKILNYVYNNNREYVNAETSLCDW